MQLSTAVRPISEVKAQAAEIIRTFSEEAAPPVVITQNGEVKAVLMGIHEYERIQETLCHAQGSAFPARVLRRARDAPLGTFSQAYAQRVNDDPSHWDATSGGLALPRGRTRLAGDILLYSN